MRQEISAEKIAVQKEIMARIRAVNEQIYTDTGRRLLGFTDTYGCQQNEADTQQIRGLLSEMGYGFTENEHEADVIVINTCAVREHAEQRVFGNVGALSHSKREKPGQIIALCGCMVQQSHVAEKLRTSFRHVDLVIGPQSLWRFPEYLEKKLSEGGRIFDLEDTRGAIYEGLPVLRDGGVRTLLPIMYGCNNFCSYCVVPYVRGRERTRDRGLILQEARDLIAAGCKDITLLGQNVNSYDGDLGGESDFPVLLEELNALNGEFLIRFMTSHPKDAGRRLFEAMASCRKAARHLHLPFQAGNDRVLSAMNRGYTKDTYLALVEMARSLMPDLVLTSDVIVGFPGESEKEFEDTLDVLKKVRFDALFTFIFSPRAGTPAENMPDPVSRAEKQKWFNQLLSLQNSISAEKHADYVGRILPVLIDKSGEDARYPLEGRTNGGRLVRLLGDPSHIGSFVQVKITGASPWSLTGELAGSTNKAGIKNG